MQLVSIMSSKPKMSGGFLPRRSQRIAAEKKEEVPKKLYSPDSYGI